MPQMLKRKIQRMKFYASIELICIVLLMISIALVFDMITKENAGTNTTAALIVSSISLTCVFLMTIINVKIKAISKETNTYAIPVSKESVEQIATALEATEVNKHAYVSLRKCGKLSGRILVQYRSEFCDAAFKKERKKINQQINRNMGIKNSVSLFEALSSFRVNLVVCDTLCPDLTKWLSRNLASLQLRNEIIIPAAIVLDQHMLIIPDCLFVLSLSQINRYSAAVQLLCSLLV